MLVNHVYVDDFSIINDLSINSQLIGDHSLVIFNVTAGNHKPTPVIRRNWRGYSKEKLLGELAGVDFGSHFTDVQSCWNSFENKMIEIVDKICPLEPFVANSTVASIKPPPHVKHKLNLRKRLLHKLKINKDPLTKIRINQLNIEIRNHFFQAKRKSIRQGLTPGNNKTLWDSVKIAKEQNINKLPEKMTYNNLPIDSKDLPDVFARHFKTKISTIVNESIVNNNVYNGQRKLYVDDHNFMNQNDINEAVSTLKLKNSEGFDRIPQRFLIDGILFTLKPLTDLFSMIYNTKNIPEQWLFSKIIPTFKKGDNKQIENYRPIANLCSTSKLFEKLILNRLMKIQEQNECS